MANVAYVEQAEFGEVVHLTSGHSIYQIQDHSGFTGTQFKTGWLAGSLYVSRDGGETWEPSDLQFRSA